jgi:hypothetical protein
MPSPVVVPAKTLGTTPIKVPETVKTPTTGSLSMANNATTGVIKADSTYTPPVNKDKEDAKGALQKILGNISGQAAAEEKIRKEEQLAEKKQRAIAISNELDQLDKSFQDQVNEIKENTQGKLASGIQQEIAVAQDRYENRRANVSLAYKVAYGDYQGAQDIVTQKVNALKDQNTQSLQAYKLFADSINDDLTESEKLQVQAQMQRKEREAQAIQDTYQNALAMAVQNNAPSSVLSAIDEASRQPGATSATILAAAGQYGGDILGRQLQQAQLANIQSQITERVNQGNIEGTVNGKPQNISQSAANGYADRLNMANVSLNLLGKDFTGSFSFGGALPNMLQSSDRQVYEQAKRNFGTAVLRRESGASIADSEFETLNKTYFPVPGDSKDVIEKKYQLRNTVINSFYREANAFRPILPGDLIEANGKKYKVDVDGQTLLDPATGKPIE